MSRHPYPAQLYTAQQAQKIDRLAIQAMDKEAKPSSGLSPKSSAYRLMLRAGEAVMGYLLIRDPKPKKLLIVCGAGNNAGDGYVIAKLAKQSGMQVDVTALVDPHQLTGEAQTAVQDWLRAGGEISDWKITKLDGFDCIIDAMLGTGLTRPLEGRFLEAVEQINASGCHIVAVDIPTGLHADSGCAIPEAVKADVTVTFIVMKQGLLTGSARNYVGELIYNDLGVHQSLYQKFKPISYCITEQLVQQCLPTRLRTAHKGDHGHVLIVGGDLGMNGAAIMAGKAALRVGAGLVSIATREKHAAMMSCTQPELMCHAVECIEDIKPLMQKASVMVVGPGLGQNQWGKMLLDVVLNSQLPLIVDADGLNLLADEAFSRSNWILTPHPGEAARLLQADSESIQSHRHESLQKLCDTYNATVILKGAASLVSQSGADHWLCDRGNPGMATAGMGDILSGICGGLAAQGIPLLETAKLAVLIHALAADLVAQTQGERGLVATDLLPSLQQLVNLNPIN